MSSSLVDTNIIDLERYTLIQQPFRDRNNRERSRWFLGTCLSVIKKIPGFPAVSRLVTQRTPVFISMELFRNLTTGSTRLISYEVTSYV